ncbi:MAG TPA: GGDEF domain-containing protein [Thermoanaerobaculia bacterium]
MSLSALGLVVQTVGAGLLALIFLYLSRDNGNRVLRAAGIGWLMLFFGLLSLVAGFQLAPAVDLRISYSAYQLFKLLYLVALGVAADRMEHESPLLAPMRTALIVGVLASAALAFFVGPGSLFFTIHMAIGAVAWILIFAFIVRSRAPGLGKGFASALAVITFLVQATYVAFFGLSALHHDEASPFLQYTGFYDLFLEMLFGIGLIIWAMEDTERKLINIHARAVDDTQRSKRRAQIDPLTEAHNRFFLDEIRSSLMREPAGGSIVLIDVDGLKEINDREGHEEGDKAIWTVAQATKKLIRGDDYLIRWGGDEFLVVLPGMDEEVAKKRFYMLPAKIEEVRQSPRSAARAYKKFLAASVGVTPFSSRVPFDMAIEMADRHMYERKKAHKQMRGDPLRRGARETPSRETHTRRTFDNKTN